MDKDAEGKIKLDQYKGLQMFYYCWNEHKIKGRNAAGEKKKTARARLRRVVCMLKSLNVTLSVT